MTSSFMSESSIDELVKEIDAYFNAHSMPTQVVEKQRPSVVAATTVQKASVVDDVAKRQQPKHEPETKILTSKRIRPQSATLLSKVEDGIEELAFPKRKKLTPNAEYNIMDPVLKSVENEPCYTPLTQLYKMYKRQQQTNAEQDDQQEFGKNFLKSVKDDRDFNVARQPKWGRTQASIDESKKADEALKKMDKEMQDDYMAWFGKPLVPMNDERASKKSI